MRFRKVVAVSYTLSIPVLSTKQLLHLLNGFASYCHQSLYLPTQFNSYLSVAGVTSESMNFIRGTKSQLEVNIIISVQMQLRATLEHYCITALCEYQYTVAMLRSVVVYMDWVKLNNNGHKQSYGLKHLKQQSG